MSRENRPASVTVVLDDCATLSSGTLATLTGLRRYDDIDRIRVALVAYVQTQNALGTTFTCWQEAWHAFVGKGVTKMGD